MMPWWCFGLLANVCIATVEYLNRTAGFATVVDALKVTWPLIVLAQIGLFYQFRDAPTFMVAWAAFFVGSATLRLASNHFLVEEPLSLGGWLGVSMILGGAVVLKVGHHAG